MDNYVVKLYARAYRDLDGIYTYIAENLSEPDTALNMVDELEQAIFSLEQLPERGAIRRVGAYSSGNYHQLFIKNYVIIYRVLKQKKEVHIVSLRYVIRQATSKIEYQIREMPFWLPAEVPRQPKGHFLPCFSPVKISP